MSEFKEVPIDDSNGVEQFKAGDTFRTWSGGVTYNLLIREIRDENIVAFLKMNNNVMEFNYKTCRKLVKREPRECWMNPDAMDAIQNQDGYSTIIARVPDPYLPVWIKVREVLEDD